MQCAGYSVKVESEEQSVLTLGSIRYAICGIQREAKTFIELK